MKVWTSVLSIMNFVLHIVQRFNRFFDSFLNKDLPLWSKENMVVHVRTITSKLSVYSVICYDLRFIDNGKHCRTVVWIPFVISCENSRFGSRIFWIFLGFTIWVKEQNRITVTLFVYKWNQCWVSFAHFSNDVCHFS